ncbi:cytidylate kinase family protein [Candidatus Micrarchaeota archaeon]|nr:cytidylate kinase family protein [Candidatus Micrarchaeota archaeon]
MIICISGLSGSGKNAVGELVAKALGLKEIKLSFKDEAKRLGIGLMELQRLASKDFSFDKKLDKKILDEANKGNCVVTTWLCSWLVKGATLRIWLNASEDVRAKRLGKRDKMTHSQALTHLRKRDANNRKRYLKYYNIDIQNHEMFDLEINTAKFTPQQIADIVVTAAKNKR